MFGSSCGTVAKLTVLSVGLAIGTFARLATLKPISVRAAPNTANFPDIQQHWTQPFIQPLAEQDIITGYLDGIFRPDQSVARDEFAAILHQAFNPDRERQIASGRVYQDVPAGHWAAPPIEEAYETGFMTGYPDGLFRPDVSISRVES